MQYVMLWLLTHHAMLQMPMQYLMLRKLMHMACFHHGHVWLQVERSRAKSGIKAQAGDKELAPVLDNSLAWGGFVATSTNVRYQLVNGFEERALVSC